MKNLDLLSDHRQCAAEREHYGRNGDHGNGIFIFKSPIDGGLLTIVASNGDGWDHVSVSRSNRCPNWPEMEFIKRMFFEEYECAMQLHVPPADHISFHPNCLHLWRPQRDSIPRPPSWMVMTKKEDA